MELRARWERGRPRSGGIERGVEAELAEAVRLDRRRGARRPSPVPDLVAVATSTSKGAVRLKVAMSAWDRAGGRRRVSVLAVAGTNAQRAAHRLARVASPPESPIRALNGGDIRAAGPRCESLQVGCRPASSAKSSTTRMTSTLGRLKQAGTIRTANSGANRIRGEAARRMSVTKPRSRRGRPA